MLIVYAIGRNVIDMLHLSYVMRPDRITRTGVLEPFAYSKFHPVREAQRVASQFTRIVGPRVTVAGRRPVGPPITTPPAPPPSIHATEAATTQAVAQAFAQGASVRLRNNKGQTVIAHPTTPAPRGMGFFSRIIQRAQAMLRPLPPGRVRGNYLPAAIGHGKQIVIKNYTGPSRAESTVAAQLWPRDPRSKTVDPAQPGDIKTQRGYAVAFRPPAAAAQAIINNIPGVAVPNAMTTTQFQAGSGFAVNQMPRELVAASVAGQAPVVALRAGNTALQEFWRRHFGTRY